jgi:hypothetical protein
MDLREVLFLGGDGGNLAAVKVRGLDIARRLGCDFTYGEKFVAQIHDRYSAYVCVKPAFRRTELKELARRGPVIWDIIDEFPPRENVAVYLASTAVAQELFANYGRVELIPHHHCNFEGQPSDPANRRPAWIGSRHWLPAFEGFNYDTYFVEGMARAEVARSFRKTGIGLNFRGEAAIRDRVALTRHAATPEENQEYAKTLYNFHVVINSGIKLINCLGFGLPSVSSGEPAYLEIGEGCTIFSDLKDCAKWVRALQNDGDLYRDFRQRCLRRSKKFHIDAIAAKYRRLLESL